MDLISTITAAAKAVSVPPALLLAICHTETRLINVVTPVDGKRASLGVCQVQLRTAQFVSQKNKLEPAYPSSLLDPSENAFYAALYLRYHLRRCLNDWGCAAIGYNSGRTFLTHQVDSSNRKSYHRYRDKVLVAVKDRPWMSAK